MKAIKKSLTDQILDKTTADRFLFCTICGQEASANSGDYWQLPDDHKFTCCGKTMIIATKKTVMTEV